MYSRIYLVCYLAQATVLLWIDAAADANCKGSFNGSGKPLNKYGLLGHVFSPRKVRSVFREWLNARVFLMICVSMNVVRDLLNHSQGMPFTPQEVLGIINCSRRNTVYIGRGSHRFRKFKANQEVNTRDSVDLSKIWRQRRALGL